MPNILNTGHSFSIRATLLCLCVIIGPILITAQTTEALKKEIDKIIYLDAELDQDEIPAMVIGIAIGDSTYFYTYQFDEKKSNTLNEHTIFEIGDLTKAFTGLICAEAMATKKIEVDPQVIFLNDDDKNYGCSKSLTQLLAHQSGLAIRPEGFGENEIELDDAYANYTKQRLENYLKKLAPTTLGEPDAFLYSHTGYAAIELFLERELQQSFDQLVQQLTAQLGLSNTYFFTPLFNSKQFPIQGYNRIGKKTPLGHYPSFGASEGMKSTAADLLSLGRLSWNQPPDWYTASFANSWQMQEKNMRVSTGWYWYLPKKFQRVVLQSGSSAGHRSFLAFVPETKTAVVVLSNSKKGHKGLGYLILKMLNFEWKHPDGRMKVRHYNQK